jgi:hypothetical protein
MGEAVLICEMSYICYVVLSVHSINVINLYLQVRTINKLWECTHIETLPRNTNGVSKHSHVALAGCQSTTT